MKKLLLSLAAAAFCICSVNAETVIYDATTKNYANQTEITEVTEGDVTIKFDKGTNPNPPKYYTSGTAIRVYGGNTITVSVPEGSSISEISFTFGSSDGSNAITADTGTFSSPTWTGSANPVIFTIGGTTGHRRITKIAVIYTAGAAPTVAKPVISCTDNMVSISCETANSSIYYTTDETAPSKESTLYPAPFEITKNTTVKAIAYVGDDASSVATYNAVYQVSGEISVAEAISLIADGYTSTAQVKGYITSIREVSTQYGNATYIISDDMTAANQLIIYRGNWLDGAKFTSEDQIEVGGQVVVEGTLTRYRSDDQMSKSKIISYTEPAMEFVANPVISPESGIVEKGTEVTITCATEGASIYYTTDGTTPDASSSVYSEPIVVNENMTVSAYAVKDGMADSRVVTASYTVKSENERTVMFDFTSTEWLTAQGVEVPTEPSTGSNVAGKSFAVAPITLSIAESTETNQARIWKKSNNQGGGLQLRVYKTDSFSIVADEKYDINSIEFVFGSSSNSNLGLAEGAEGTFEGGVWKAPENKEITSVSFKPNATVYIDKINVQYELGSGVAEVEADENEAPVYYNMQGMRVANPENGLYIVVKGNKTSKVLIRK